jgi:TetR/AcrR family transcriptional repressor of nem operon
LDQSLSKLNSPLKKIYRVFSFSIDELLNDKERRGCLIVNTTTELGNLENSISLFAKGNMEDHEKFFQDLVKEGQQSGEISKSLSSLTLARHLFNSLVGLRVIAQTTSDRKTLDDIARGSLSVLYK